MATQNVVITTTTAHFEEVHDLILRGGAAQEIEEMITSKTGGPKRILTVAIFLTCRTIYYESTNTQFNRAMYWNFMRNLPVNIRIKYGLSDKTGTKMLVTEHQVHRLWNRITKALEFKHTGEDDKDYEQEAKAGRFWELMDDYLDGFQPDNLEPPKAMALDSTALEVYSRRTGKRIDGTVGKDPDMHGGYRTPTQTKPTSDYWGFDALTFVAIPAGDEDYPNICTNVRLVPGAQDQARSVEDVILSRKRAGNPFSELIADRAYSNYKPERYRNMLRREGIKPVIDIALNQQGPVWYEKDKDDNWYETKEHSGIPIICGEPFCPSIPRDLWVIVKPKNMTWEDIDPLDTPENQAKTKARNEERLEFKRKIAERQKYALKPVGYTNKGRRWRCGAWKGQKRCGNCPFSLGYTDDKPLNDNPPKDKSIACRQETFTVPFTVQPKLQQEYSYGSEAWTKRWNKRVRVEGFYGDLESPDKGGIHKGWVKAVGLVKNAISMVIAATVRNMANLAAWQRRHPEIEADSIMSKPKVDVHFVELPVEALYLLESTEPPDIAWILANAA